MAKYKLMIGMQRNNSTRICVQTLNVEHQFWELHGIFERETRALDDALGNLSCRLPADQYRAIPYAQWKYGTTKEAMV